MRTRRIVFSSLALALAAAALLSSLPAAAAWLESGDPPPRRTWVTPAPTPWPTPWPIYTEPDVYRPPQTGAAAAVRALLASASLGTPEGYGSLTIVPIVATGRVPATSISSMDDAVRSGRLRVYESGAGSVPTVMVENVSATPVFLLAGEIVLGGKQDRVIREDTVIGAYSGAVSVPVYCVEEGRWTSGTTFRSAPEAVADAGLRAKAASGAGQDAIWSHVSEKASAAGVHSSTSAYREFEQSPEVSRRLDEYVARCPRPTVWRGRVVGAVFVSGGTVLGVDIVGDPSLLASLWPKLVRSYAAHVYDYGGGGWGGARIDPARAALSALQSAWPRESGWAGSGTRVELDAPGFDATAVVHGGAVIHLAAFPAASIQIRYPPPPPPPPPPLPTPWPWYPFPEE
ncbi:MAG TPA: DUF6569 family protein [bacterium]|nr:DUF6569 family protein [bacterium]